MGKALDFLLPWDSQPQEPTSPNDAYARDLALLINPGVGYFDAVRPRAVTANGISIATGQLGRCFDAASNASIGAAFARSRMSTSDGAGSGDFSILVVANPTASATREMLFSITNGTQEFYFAVNAGIALGASSGTVSPQTNSGGAAGVAQSGGADGQMHVWLYVREAVASDTGYLYRDGVLVASGGLASPNAVMWSSASADNVGGWSGTNWGISQSVALVAGWNRVVTAAEAVALTQSLSAPWQLFAPRSISVPVSAAGPSSYTLTAAAGSYALTGNAAGLRASRRLSAAAGSFALTGNAAGLYRGLRLTAAAGAYAWTGNDATLLQSRRLLAAAASYTLTGNAAALRAARQLSASAASYTFTGNAAGLTYTPLGSYSLAAAAGSYAFTGNNTAVRASRRLAAAPGIFNLTGTAAQLLRGYRLVAAVQTYVWTGNAATLSKSQSYSLLASTATYGWTGTAAGLIYSGAPAVVRYASRSRIFTTGRELRSILTQRAVRSITP